MKKLMQPIVSSQGETIAIAGYKPEKRISAIYLAQIKIFIL
jgi:hypothetical protein